MRDVTSGNDMILPMPELDKNEKSGRCGPLFPKCVIRVDQKDIATPSE